MRILFCSHAFAPSVGGIETVSRILAGKFVKQGHEVVLVTQTQGGANFQDGYRIHRRPSALALLRLVRHADVVFHNNICLRLAWPLLLVRRPWVVAHHTWIPRHGFAGRTKRWLLRFAIGIAASRALASDLDTPSTVVPNPYEEQRFRELQAVTRDRDLVFLGRLVSDKGCDILLDALALLALQHVRPTVTIIGDGPDRTQLESQARDKGLGDRIRFSGTLQGDALMEALNGHRILVVPSRWQEPFGLVALEGIACGCMVVASDGGGLPDAVGPCGLTFRRGDASELAATLGHLLADAALQARLLAAAPAHLAAHRPDAVARGYLSVLARATGAESHV